MKRFLTGDNRVGLETLKLIIREKAEELDLDSYDLQDLEEINSVNQSLGGMSLLYRVLTCSSLKEMSGLLNKLKKMVPMLL